jgi:hypothetical protein
MGTQLRNAEGNNEGEKQPTLSLEEIYGWLQTAPEDSIVDLIQKIYDVRQRHRVEKAEVLYGCKVIKCNTCNGHGQYGISAGDGDWTEKCETCEATGFVPEEFHS